MEAVITQQWLLGPSSIPGSHLELELFPIIRVDTGLVTWVIRQYKSLTPYDIFKKYFGMSLNNNTYATKKTIAQVQQIPLPQFFSLSCCDLFFNLQTGYAWHCPSHCERIPAEVHPSGIFNCLFFRETKFVMFPTISGWPWQPWLLHTNAGHAYIQHVTPGEYPYFGCIP